MKKYVNPHTVEVSVPNPDDPRDMPIFEGPANRAHEFLITGQYPATINDPYSGNEYDVMLHVYAEGEHGQSTAYNLPDHLREHAWNNDFARRVAECMGALYGFVCDDSPDGTGISFTVGIVRFTMSENMSAEPGQGQCVVFAQDTSDTDDQDFARVVAWNPLADEDISYRGSWSAYEAARQFSIHAVRQFAAFADKRAAHADHTI